MECFHSFRQRRVIFSAVPLDLGRSAILKEAVRIECESFEPMKHGLRSLPVAIRLSKRCYLRGNSPQ
jgi:hypothetical protein